MIENIADIFAQNREKLIEKFPRFTSVCTSLSPIENNSGATFSEAKTTVQKALSNEVIFCLGLDSTIFQALKKWIEKKDRYLVFLENDPQKIAQFLSQKEALVLLLHPKVVIEYVDPQFSWEQFFKERGWQYVFLRSFMIYLPHQKQLYFRIEPLFAESFSAIHFIASNASDFGVGAIKNIVSNALYNPYLFTPESLKGLLKNSPAIIVGAGPSLDLCIEEIKKTLPHAFLLVSGSSMQALEKHRIPADIIAHIDPFSAYKRTVVDFHKKAPFFFQNRIDPDWVKNVEGTKIAVHDYEKKSLEKWLYGDRSLIDLDTGWNGTTFLTALALFLGCNPIIFVGVDLCFVSKRYAKGVTTPQFTDDLIQTKDMEGNSVYTQKDWLLAKNWIEELSQKHTDTTFINATKGGIGLQIFSQSLLEISLKDTLQKESVMEMFSQKKAQSVDIKSRYIALQKSMHEVDKICRDWDTFYHNIEGLKKQPFYQLVFIPVWNVWEFVFKREVQQEKSPHPENMRLLLHQFLFLQNVTQQFISKIGKLV